MECQVLRCATKATHVFAYLSEPRLEITVCEAHKHALDEGAEYVVNEDDNAVLMGDDLKTAELRLITAFTTAEDFAGLPEGSAIFEFEYQDGTPGRLLLGSQAIDHLKRLLDTFQRPE